MMHRSIDTTAHAVKGSAKTQMSRDWESWLRTAARPASATEEAERDRTVARIRAAIVKSREIPATVRVYAKGSYANNTNVRRDSDVDVAVEWTATFDVHTWGETGGMSAQQLGYTAAPVHVDPFDFRSRVERALVAEFGTAAVDTTGDKAINVLAGAGTLDADVVPCIEMRRYDAPGLSHQGQRLYPLSGGFIDNYPQQNYDNGVTKNNATGGRYKDVVRGLKRLEGELVAAGTLPSAYPGYLTECLVYNVPNGYFGSARLVDDLRGALTFLWAGLRTPPTYESWLEVNELLFLFRGHPNRSISDAHRLVDAAWSAIGITG